MSKTISKKEIIKYLNELSKQGKEIQIKWEGGNDSGWIYLEIDSVEDNSEEAETLSEYMNNLLDYGSWTGDFNADGYATYNPKTKCFEGENSYSEYEEDLAKADITIKIPDHLWFDRLILEIECSYDEKPDISFNLDVIDGFKLNTHETFEKKMEIKLIDDVEKMIENHNDNNEDRSIDRIFTLELINKDQFQHIDGHFVYTIDKLDVSVRTVQTSDIVLDINNL